MGREGLRGNADLVPQNVECAVIGLSEANATELLSRGSLRKGRPDDRSSGGLALLSRCDSSTTGRMLVERTHPGVASHTFASR